MELRFYEDPDTGQPHIYGHGVTEQEVEEVLRGRGEDFQAARGARQKLGQTSAGRYLKVIYVPAEGPSSVFVITAYELREGQKSLSPPTKEKRKTSKPNFPAGWDEQRVREVLAHYEQQTEDEEFAEIEAALEVEDTTLMAIPTELVPEVRALLARKQSA